MPQPPPQQLQPVMYARVLLARACCVGVRVLVQMCVRVHGRVRVCACMGVRVLVRVRAHVCARVRVRMCVRIVRMRVRVCVLALCTFACAWW